MEEENKVIQEVISEIKSADETELRTTIEKWYEQTRNQGIKLGANYICAVIHGIIQKHTKKPGKTSLRDYERCITDINKVVLVPLQQDDTQQNDLATEE